jgi:hypothetical protein
MTAEQLEEIIAPTVTRNAAQHAPPASSIPSLLDFKLVCDKCQKSERPWECKCLGSDERTKEQLEAQLREFKAQYYTYKKPALFPEPRYTGKIAPYR